MTDSQSNVVGMVVLCAVIITAFAPLLVLVSRSRKGLGNITTILTLVGIAGSGGSLLAPGLVTVALLPAFGLLWLGALLCGIAGFLDAAAERRNEQAIYRLINEEPQRRTEPKLR